MRARASRRPAPRSLARQRGFTLIELMIALVVSSLLVGMILAIFMRMSIAYRGQQQIAEVQSKLAAARAMIELDAKHAGLDMAQGFSTAFSGGLLYSPLRVINNAGAPDEVAFFYADTQVQAAAVTTIPGTCDQTSCQVLDATTGFAIGDLVVATRASAIDSPYVAAGDAQISTFRACVLQVTSVGANSLDFSTAAPWGQPGNTHCTNAVPGSTIYYKLIAHHWRIDPARPADGVLQLSRTGNLLPNANDWQDMAFGFTDLQVATRFYDGDANDTLDPDLDPERDWYSGDQQEELTKVQAAFTPPIQISISLVARTERDVEGIASTSTPKLIDDTNPANNMLGDRDAIALPSADPALEGNRIFRYTTFQVDLRNLGVGR